MKIISTIKNILSSSIAFFLLTACGGGSGTTSTTHTSQTTQNEENTYISTTNGEEVELDPSSPICKRGDTFQEGQIKDTNTNIGISNVTITIAGCTTQTNENGFYKLSNIISDDKAIVNFNKEGYYKNSIIINIDDETSNYLEFSLEKYKSWNPWHYSSKEGTFGGPVEISSNAKYTDVNNHNYEGNITAYWLYKNITTTNARDLFPGNYEGLNSNGIIVPFVSYAFIRLELKNNLNNDLSISENIKLKLKDVKDIQDQTIPLWFYDYDKGIWIEEGSAQRDENGDYICEISHTGTWSISKPIETEMGLYRGRIVDENENPISHVRIQAMGQNWINKDLTTDENGVFEIQVVPDQEFTLAAYDYKEKFGARFPNTISGISSGEIVEE